MKEPTCRDCVHYLGLPVSDAGRFHIKWALKLGRWGVIPENRTKAVQEDIERTAYAHICFAEDEPKRYSTVGIEGCELFRQKNAQ